MSTAILVGQLNKQIFQRTTYGVHRRLKDNIGLSAISTSPVLLLLRQPGLDGYWGRIAATKKEGPSPKRRPVPSFYCYAVLLRCADEQQNEGEQNQRFNESKADKQCELDPWACTRVSGKCFCHGAGDLTLSESSQTGGKTHSKTNADRHCPVTGSGCAGSLSVYRRRDHQDRNYQKQKREFPHLFLLMICCQWVVDVRPWGTAPSRWRHVTKQILV
jgi:hypothetical protein